MFRSKADVARFVPALVIEAECLAARFCCGFAKPAAWEYARIMCREVHRKRAFAGQRDV